MVRKKILNYTRQPISIITSKGVITIPSHGHASCASSRELIEYLDIEGTQVPVNKTIFGAVGRLPEEKDDTIIIVSALMANVLRKTRGDIYVVDEPVREFGRIVGCRALAKIVEY